MAPDVGVTTGVCTLWQEEELVDYTIEVEDEQFRVHKVIIASVSDYFKAMLTGGMNESHTDKVRLEGLDPVAVSNMIEFIYTGQFGSKTARTEDLLGCAVYFQFPAAIEKCTELLYEEITYENCFDVLTIFKAYCLEDCVECTLSYMKSNIDNILKICQPNELPHNDFLLLMDFWGKSEWDLFDSANLWISVDFENRVKYLNDLMSHLRFALMTPEELAAVQDSYIYSNFKESWCNLVHKAIKHHNLPTQQKILDDTEQNKVRGDPSPVCFSVEYDCMNSDRLGVYYVGKSWTQNSVLQPFNINVPAVVLEVNNYLIVCDAFDYDDPSNIQNWYIFDPRGPSWCTMPRMATARDNFALVHHGRHLYALGGLVSEWETPEGVRWSHAVDSSIERFHFETNSWCEISSKLPVARQEHGACAISGSIYITGGLESVKKGYHSNTLDCFDPSTETWESKAPLTRPICYCKALVMNLWKEEIMFVIGQRLEMQYYTPSTNQWSVYQWNNYVDSELTSAHGGVVLGSGKVFVLLRYMREKTRSELSGWSWDRTGQIQVGCAKWTVKERGQKITEDPLDDFPLGEPCNMSGFCALLSFKPEPAAAQAKCYPNNQSILSPQQMVYASSFPYVESSIV